MKDILIDSTGDLLIKNGDFVIGRSDDIHKEVLLVTDKGSFKEDPTIGVGLAQFLEGENSDDLLSEIRKQFTADGITIDKISNSNGKFPLDGHY